MGWHEWVSWDGWAMGSGDGTGTGDGGIAVVVASGAADASMAVIMVPGASDGGTYSGGGTWGWRWGLCCDVKVLGAHWPLTGFTVALVSSAQPRKAHGTYAPQPCQLNGPSSSIPVFSGQDKSLCRKMLPQIFCMMW